MIEHSTFRLANGLRVVHHRDPYTAMVAVNVLYDVGARDESAGLTGIAHLFEHLMFGGSANVARFDKELHNAGGQSNAWTSNDFTNFYDILPAVNAETAFRLESDRMISPALTPKALDVQRRVVVEEFRQQCLNRPYGDLMHGLRALCFTRHPYRWPVIGLEPAHVEAVTAADARAFFDSHYGPGSAILAVAGNITLDETRRLAEKWFGDIPARPVAPRAYAPEPPQTAPRSGVMTGRVPLTCVTVAYPMEGYGTEDYFAADLLTDVLSNGRSSRFQRRLAMQHPETFASTDAFILGSEEPGLLILSARLTPGADEERAISLLTETAAATAASDPVTPHELTKAINRNSSAMLFGNLSYLNVAQQLAVCALHGEDINDQLAPYRALSPEAVRSHAASIFSPEKANTLIYRPE